MISNKSDYYYVSPESLKHIEIKGKPYPVRSQKLILTGEDEAFLAEAVAERNPSKPYMFTDVIQEIRTPTSSPDATGWYKEESLETIRPQREIYYYAGEWKSDYEKYKEAIRSASNTFTNWVKEQNEQHDKEKAQKQQEWTEEEERRKKSQLEKEKKAQSTRVEKTDEITREKLSAIEREEDRHQSVTEDIGSKHSAGELSDYEAVIEQEKEDEEFAKNKEEIDVEADKETYDAQEEYDIAVAEAQEEYDKWVEKTKEEMSKWEREWQKKYNEAYDSKEMDYYSGCYQAAKDYSTSNLGDYCPKQLSWDRDLDKATIKTSCLTAYAALQKYGAVPNSDALMCKFADLERMVCKAGGTGAERLPYILTISGGGNTTKQASNDRTVDRDFCSYLGKTPLQYTYSSRTFRVYYGNRWETERKLIDYIECVVTGVRFCAGDRIEEDEDGGTVITASCVGRMKNVKLVKFSYAGISSEGDLSKIDAADDAYDKTIKDLDEELAKTKEEQEKKKKKMYKNAEKGYVENVKAAEETMERAIEAAQKKRFSKVSEGVESVNKTIKEGTKEEGEKALSVWWKNVEKANDELEDEIENEKEEYNKKVEEYEKEKEDIEDEADEEYVKKMEKATEEVNEKKKEAKETNKRAREEVTKSRKEKEQALYKQYTTRLSQIQSEYVSTRDSATAAAENAINKLDPVPEVEWFETSVYPTDDWIERHPDGWKKIKGDMMGISQTMYSIVEPARKKCVAAQGEASRDYFIQKNSIDPLREGARMKFEASIEPMSESVYTGSPNQYNGSEDIYVLSAFVHIKPRTLTGENFKDYYDLVDKYEDEYST